MFASTADTGGWHVFAASSGDGWQWHALATLLPRGNSDETWIGQQCVTGDGREVVAVVAPWHANNDEADVNHGATAYSVDAHTGRVRPLARGVSLAYFNPGCGSGSQVALTTYPGAGQGTTWVSVVDATTGASVRSAAVSGEITSAVPAGDAIIGAQRDRVVQLTGQQVRVLGQVTAEAYDLRANDAGGVDLLAGVGTAPTIWELRTGRLRQVGTGASSDVSLVSGRAGRNQVVGASGLIPAAHVRALPARGSTRVAAVSLDGGAIVSDHPAAASTRQAAGARPGTVPMVATATGQPIGSALPPPSPRLTTEVPAKDLSRKPGTATAAPTVNTTAPTCAVPRNDIWNQVLQPNAQQIDWAIQEAAHGWLTPANSSARPPAAQNYKVADSAPLPTFYPSLDFPPGTISGTSATVPQNVMYGIFAQESNWNQASFHALAGYGGNPFVANYYGSTDPANPSDINYDSADCGYGLGQLTDIMKKGAPGITQATQVAVATDYAENTAAAVQALVTKWNQLAGLGDLMNNGDPTVIENWYAAIWAYNSGVHLGAGGSGLGWFNNPANPIYPVNRPGFLRSTYDDSKHPQDWPYQEKVFGWMETAQTDPNAIGSTRYIGLGANTLHLPPPQTFCKLTVNSCDPSAIGGSDPSGAHGQVDPCPSESSACWWNQPASWLDCSQAMGCTTGSAPSYAPTSPEPQLTPRVPNCTVGSDLPSNAIIVDDMAMPGPNPGGLDPNVVGCPTTPTDWHNAGTFELDTNLGVPIGPSDIAGIDLHQIGTGFGGHSWFTHTIPDSNAEVIATWSPTLSVAGLYDVRVFVPTPGAETTNAHYEIHGFSQGGAYGTTLDQNPYNNQWVSIGKYPLLPGAFVTLGSVTPPVDPNQGADIAFSAMAFVPVAPDDTIRVDSAASYPFQGWGTSLAWWANVVGSSNNQGGGADIGTTDWHTSTRQTIEHELFDAPDPAHPGGTQLGLTVLRYNIGASPATPAQWPSSCTQRVAARSQVPSPQQGPGAPVNLAVDNRQLNVMTEVDTLLKAQGQVTHYEAFANSPPWWMTVSGCPTGRAPLVVTDNLDPSQYAAYVTYLVTVLQKFKQMGISFDTVSPFNEPALFAWPAGCVAGRDTCQEGANFQEPTQDTIIGQLCQALRSSGLTTGVAADDGNTVDATINDWTSYGGASKQCLARLNTHGYNWGNEADLSGGYSPYTGVQRPRLAAVAAGNGKQVWMSEFGAGGSATDMGSAITLSRQIAKDVQYMRVGAWVNWQAVEGPGGWGLLEAGSGFPFEALDSSGNPVPMVPTKRYYALAQYSQFIRPNSTILSAHGSGDAQQATLAVAARNPSNGTVYLVATNDSSSERGITFDLSALGINPGHVSVYRTTPDVNVAPGPDPFLVGSSFSDAQPPQSVTTYVVTPQAGASRLSTAASPTVASALGTGRAGDAVGLHWYSGAAPAYRREQLASGRAHRSQA